MLEKIKIWTIAAIAIAAFEYGLVKLVNHVHADMDAYAAEHNCRWDYNDMCYTIEERPWLFNDNND